MNYDIKQCQEIVEKELKKLAFGEKKPKSLYEPIQYILESGGKRIRPAMTLLACNLFSENIDTAIAPALGLEVFHNFTLLHDDVLDQADIRRGQPTVHKKWNENTAILSGDAMMILAYELFMSGTYSNCDKIVQIFNKTALQICEGQQYDLDFENTLKVSIPDYIEMITLKTSVLLAAAVQIGALAGGASEEDAEQLYNWGLNIGVAFQLQDDLLDTYANVDKFGKNIGGDIIANKKTFLLLSVLELVDENDHVKIMELLSNFQRPHSEKIKLTIDLYNKYNVKQRTEEKIQEYFNKANGAMEALKLSADKENMLITIRDMLIKREN